MIKDDIRKIVSEASKMAEESSSDSKVREGVVTALLHIALKGHENAVRYELLHSK